MLTHYVECDFKGCTKRTKVCLTCDGKKHELIVPPNNKIKWLLKQEGIKHYCCINHYHNQQTLTHKQKAILRKRKKAIKK